MTLPPRQIRPLLLALALFTLGCPTRREGPDLPELGDQSNQVTRRLERTRRIQEVMSRDLERVTQISEGLSKPFPELFSEPFPLDLFKHVAVGCLNASASETDELPGGPGEMVTELPAEEGEPEVDLACQPRFLGVLATRLQVEAPDKKSRALGILKQVDDFHTLRVRLRLRTGKTEDILESNREYLASRRADLRKLRRRWEERRQELTGSDWRELERRMTTYRSQLDRLEGATDALEEASEDWPSTIDRANRQMYFAVTAYWRAK